MISLLYKLGCITILVLLYKILEEEREENKADWRESPEKKEAPPKHTRVISPITTIVDPAIKKYLLDYLGFYNPVVMQTWNDLRTQGIGVSVTLANGERYSILIPGPPMGDAIYGHITFYLDDLISHIKYSETEPVRC